MIKNYLKIALRNLWKERLYAFINIGGLSIGLASALFIFMYVNQELSYDKFHANSDRIYRVGHKVSLGTGSKVIASSAFKTAPFLKTDFPELQEVTHFSRIYAGEVTFENKKLREERIAFVDSSFFKVFNFKLLKGNKKTAFTQPNTLVITQRISHKYFGDQDPIGMTLKVQEPFGDRDMELMIVGVIEDMPQTSHFHIDLLVSMNTGNTFYPKSLYDNWGWDSQYTYVKLPPEMFIENFREQLKTFGEKHVEGKAFLGFFAQPINEIHLHSHLNSEIEANSNIIYVYIFSIVAIIILVLACVNYMNLATAKAVKRSKEVCVRKVVGAGKRHIIFQFIGESIAFSIIALILGGLIAEVTSSQIENLLGVSVEIGILQNPSLLLAYIGIGLFIGFLSGCYPAFYISAFQPAQIIRTAAKHSGSNIWLRKGLVVFQFALSIALIIGSVVVYNQLHLLRNKKLGANIDQTVIISSTNAIADQIEVFKTAIGKNTHVKSVTTSNRRIGRDINSGTFYEVENNGEKSSARLSNIFVDYNFLEQYNVALKTGRYFSKDYAADTTINVILNESALKALDITDPEKALNKEIDAYFKAKIVGVVKDFNFEPLHNKIKPMIFILNPDYPSWISVKIDAQDMSNTIAYIEDQWQAIESNREFRYSFLDDDLYKLYIGEEHFSKVFTVFVVLAVFIACLGLLGLVTYSISQRVKEIGIRKVFGASISDITLLVTNDFIKLIILANLIAYPIAYFGADIWLQNFEYRIDVPWWGFVISTAMALLIALMTISYKSIKAASANPIDSLKEE